MWKGKEERGWEGRKRVVRAAIREARKGKGRKGRKKPEEAESQRVPALGPPAPYYSRCVLTKVKGGAG